MKKSKLIVWASLLPIAFFFLSFQWSMHQYMKKVPANKKNEPFVSQTREVGHFNQLSVGEGIQLFFKQDSLSILRVEAPENELPYLLERLEGTKLFLELSGGDRSAAGVKVYLNNAQLTQLTVSKGGSFKTLDTLSGQHLKLRFDDNSSGILQLSYKSVKCEVAPGAKVQLTGNSEQIDFSN